MAVTGRRSFTLVRQAKELINVPPKQLGKFSEKHLGEAFPAAIGQSFCTFTAPQTAANSGWPSDFASAPYSLVVAACGLADVWSYSKHE